MRNQRHSSIFILAIAPIVAACGDDAPAKIDAPIQVLDMAIDAPPDAPPDAAPDAPPAPANLTCLTTPIPTTTAAATVTMSGTSQTVGITGASPTNGAVVTARLPDNMPATGVTPSNPVTTPANGNFSLTIPTMGNAVDGHLLITATGLRNTLVYPPNPLVADQDMIPVLMFSQTTFGLLEQVGDAEEGTGNGTLALAIVDCAQDPIEGAIVTVKQGGTAVGEVRYARPFMGFPAPDPTAMSTDNTGTVFVFGVPGGIGGAGGDSVIEVTVSGTALRPSTVTAFPQSTTITVVAP